MRGKISFPLYSEDANHGFLPRKERCQAWKCERYVWKREDKAWKLRWRTWQRESQV